MSILSKLNLSSFFGLSDEEDYEYDIPTEAPEPASESYAAQRTSYTSPREEQVSSQYDRPAYSDVSKRARETSNKVVNMKSPRQETSRVNREKISVPAATSTKITVIEPRVYSEAMSIAKSIMRNESVIVNFGLVEEYQARRIVDFLTGTVYAMDGDIQRVGDEIFLCTPKNIEIDSSVAKSIFEDSNQFFN